MNLAIVVFCSVLFVLHEVGLKVGLLQIFSPECFEISPKNEREMHVVALTLMLGYRRGRDSRLLPSLPDLNRERASEQHVVVLNMA